MNIISYVVTFTATTARKTFFGTGPTHTSLFRYVNSRSMLEKNNNIIHFHLKITMFYSREKMNYWPGSINLMFQVF